MKSIENEVTSNVLNTPNLADLQKNVRTKEDNGQSEPICDHLKNVSVNNHQANNGTNTQQEKSKVNGSSPTISDDYHRYILIDKRASQFCEYCSMFIDDDQYQACISCGMKVHDGKCYLESQRGCDKSSSEFEGMKPSDSHIWKPSASPFKKCIHCRGIVFPIGLRCGDCKAIVHRKEREHVDFCKVKIQKSLNSMTQTSRAGASTYQNNENSPTNPPGNESVRKRPKYITRKHQSVKFTTTTDKNKAIRHSDIIYKINDSQKFIHFWVLTKNRIRVFESSSPGSNCLREILFKDVEMFVVGSEEDPFKFKIDSGPTVYYVLKNQVAMINKVDQMQNFIQNCITPFITARLVPYNSFDTKKQHTFDEAFEIDPNNVLGSGQFGIVYNGKDKIKNREVAIKVITSKATNYDEIVKEFKIMENIIHLNIVKSDSMFPFGEDKVVVVMEKLGIDYLTFILEIHDGTISERLAVFYTYQCVHGLTCLHKNQIVHSDIKPENLLLSPNVSSSDDYGVLKISDFGLSKFLKMNEFRKTVCGSRHYMAIEIVQGKAYDTRVDCWGVGVVHYASLLGVFPFNGESPEDMNLGLGNNSRKTIFDEDGLSMASRCFLKSIFCQAVYRFNSYQLLESEYFSNGGLIYDLVQMIQKLKLPINSFTKAGSISDIMGHYEKIKDKYKAKKRKSIW